MNFPETLEDEQLYEVLEGQQQRPTTVNRRERCRACFADDPVPDRAFRHEQIASCLCRGVIGNLQGVKFRTRHSRKSMAESALGGIEGRFLMGLHFLLPLGTLKLIRLCPRRRTPEKVSR